MSALKAVLTPEADDFRERVYYDLPSVAQANATAAGGGAA